MGQYGGYLLRNLSDLKLDRFSDKHKWRIKYDIDV